jgi:formylglycine-generating enzyme required for sulfatase activity
MLRVSCAVVAAFLVVGCTAAATIETVFVGNAGNAPDPETGLGAVGYDYRIGKYEVTNAEYVAFLNAVDPAGADSLALYDGNMSSDVIGGIDFDSGAADGSKYVIKSGRGNNPVVYVSWFDAIRFTNWLHNGQGRGDTESGAYTLSGGAATPNNGSRITRNAGAKWWLPSEDEWYKAAFHKNDGITGNYWDYPTSADEVPYSDQPPGSDAREQSNTVNYFKDDGVANGYDEGFAATGLPFFAESQNHLTDVGAYTLSRSSYGTFDQGGNVMEWNEDELSRLSSFRRLRGGSWGDGVTDNLHATFSFGLEASTKFGRVGFRVASIVPEPSTLLMVKTLAAALLLRQRPKRKCFGALKKLLMGHAAFAGALDALVVRVERGAG